MYDDWRSLLLERFPTRDMAIAQCDWAALKQRLRIGQSVSGIVITKAAFGAWIDIAVGFPALLLIPDVDGLTPELYRTDDWCPVDSVITAEIAVFNDVEFVVRVSQGTPHENRVRPVN